VISGWTIGYARCEGRWSRWRSAIPPQHSPTPGRIGSISTNSRGDNSTRSFRAKWTRRFDHACTWTRDLRHPGEGCRIYQRAIPRPTSSLQNKWGFSFRVWVRYNQQPLLVLLDGWKKWGTWFEGPNDPSWKKKRRRTFNLPGMLGIWFQNVDFYGLKIENLSHTHDGRSRCVCLVFKKVI